ncbi:MAG: hypothetical protein IPP47_19680 [Bryobacterales bacterium]|nr:hypothetical protein [Bryobacterales bacterium]
MDSVAALVPGYAELAELCVRQFPSFHDAEILSLHLNRDGVSNLRIRLVSQELRHVAAGGGDAADSVVTFRLEEISDLELRDFSCQNVISGLTLSKTESGIRLELGPCYGLAGWLEARRVSIEWTPEPLAGGDGAHGEAPFRH